MVLLEKCLVVLLKEFPFGAARGIPSGTSRRIPSGTHTPTPRVNLFGTPGGISGEIPVETSTRITRGIPTKSIGGTLAKILSKIYMELLCNFR